MFVFVFCKHRREVTPSEDRTEILRKELPSVVLERPQLRVDVLRDVPCEHGFTRATCSACVDWTERPTGRQAYYPKATAK
jgi:hypothetical protein